MAGITSKPLASRPRSPGGELVPTSQRGTVRKGGGRLPLPWPFRPCHPDPQVHLDAPDHHGTSAPATSVSPSAGIHTTWSKSSVPGCGLIVPSTCPIRLRPVVDVGRCSPGGGSLTAHRTLANGRASVMYAYRVRHRDRVLGRHLQHQIPVRPARLRFVDEARAVLR